MDKDEVIANQLRDQAIMTLKNMWNDLERIAENGPLNNDEYDKRICRMMAHFIKGEIIMENHNNKIEGEE